MFDSLSSSSFPPHLPYTPESQNPKRPGKIYLLSFMFHTLLPLSPCFLFLLLLAPFLISYTKDRKKITRTAIFFFFSIFVVCEGKKRNDLEGYTEGDERATKGIRRKGER